MTNNAIEAAERDTYSVLEYKRNGKFVAWMTKVGYHTPGKTPKEIKQNREKGIRVRSWQYHGKVYAAAQQAALDLGKQWEEIVADYRKAKALHQTFVRAEMAAARANGYYMVGDDQVPFREDRLLALMNESAPPLPVWPTKDVPKKTPAEV